MSETSGADEHVVASLCEASAYIEHCASRVREPNSDNWHSAKCNRTTAVRPCKPCVRFVYAARGSGGGRHIKAKEYISK